MILGLVSVHPEHDFSDSDIAGEPTEIASGVDLHPCFRTAPELDGEGQRIPGVPDRQTAPAVPLRGAVLMALSGRLDFHTTPFPGGGWERLFGW